MDARQSEQVAPSGNICSVARGLDIYCVLMRLSFLPGQLFLERLENGKYQLRQGSAILGQFKSKRQAVSAFNQLRQKLESEFPAKDLSPEEKRRLMIEEVVRNSIAHNSLRNAGPRKPTGTRTFG